MTPEPKTIFVGQRKLKVLYPDLFEHATRSGSRAAANQFWSDTLKEYQIKRNEFEKEIEARRYILDKEWENAKEFLKREETPFQYHGLISEQVFYAIDQQIDKLEAAKERGLTYEDFIRQSPEVEEIPDQEQIEKFIPEIAIPKRSQLTGVVEKFLEDEEKRINQDKTNKRRLSPRRFAAKKSALTDIIDHLGNMHIDEINSKTVKKVHDYIDGMDLAEISKRDKLGVFREFITWTIEEEYKQDLPANLNSKKLQFHPDKKTPESATIAEAKYVVGKLKSEKRPLLELAVLLHINCGMESGNIADLRRSEVDLKKGTLTYKRDKADKHEQIKAVTYPLWKRTLTLLRELESDHKELWLVNRRGNHLGTDSNGNRQDLIGKAFGRFKNKHATKYKRALKDFRKTGSTELQEIGYGDLADQLLQHSATDTTGTWYNGQFRQRFEDGVKELEKVFGFK
tara:strand:+ start:6776 stop:8140 length:1365 start_codon:yes stop_codon:yes gene_type:complete